MEAPIGFTIAMSCVLANRVLLNVKEAGVAVNTLSISGRTPYTPRYDTNQGDLSFCSPGTLSQFEMGQLRSMRVNYPLEDIFEGSSDDDDEYDTKNVPWVVRWKDGWFFFRQFIEYFYSSVSVHVVYHHCRWKVPSTESQELPFVKIHAS